MRLGVSSHPLPCLRYEESNTCCTVCLLQTLYDSETLALCSFSYLRSVQRWYTSKWNCSDSGKENDTFTDPACPVELWPSGQRSAVCRQIHFTLRATHWSKHGFPDIQDLLQTLTNVSCNRKLWNGNAGADSNYGYFGSEMVFVFYTFNHFQLHLFFVQGPLKLSWDSSVTSNLIASSNCLFLQSSATNWNILYFFHPDSSKYPLLRSWNKWLEMECVCDMKWSVCSSFIGL